MQTRAPGYPCPEEIQFEAVQFIDRCGELDLLRGCCSVFLLATKCSSAVLRLLEDFHELWQRSQSQELM